MRNILPLYLFLSLHSAPEELTWVGSVSFAKNPLVEKIVCYFSFNRRLNRAQVTYWASRGKPIVHIVLFQETTIHFIIYGGGHLISMEERIFT